MVRSRSVKGPGSARTEGARRATGVRADAAAGGAGALAPGQRWSASRKRDVVLRLLRGESLDAVSREVGVELYRLEAWKERGPGRSRAWAEGSGWGTGGRGAGHGQASHWGAVDGGGTAAGPRPCRGAPPPFADAEVATMSATTSATTGRRYGIQRVCQAWERSRSTHYARRARARRRERGEPARRGPTPAHSDAQLLAAVRADLARSPFQGEGHRKVHARLRILDGIRVARTRVLRVMRAHGLLSPHRGRQGDPQLHDGTIITAAPHVMWGTDGVRVFTVDDGWVWTFAAVDHWNAECVGWHVCKVGNRFAALEPIAHGLRQRYGSVDAEVARGLALRMDHGSQYLSDHFLHQIRYWGIRPSFGFLEEPETKRRRGAVEPHAQGASDLRSSLSASRRRARRRRRLRRAVQPELAPREAWLSDADRSARGVRATPGRVAQTCVQETGCGTPNHVIF